MVVAPKPDLVLIHGLDPLLLPCAVAAHFLYGCRRYSRVVVSRVNIRVNQHTTRDRILATSSVF